MDHLHGVNSNRIHIHLENELRAGREHIYICISTHTYSYIYIYIYMDWMITHTYTQTHLENKLRCGRDQTFIYIYILDNTHTYLNVRIHIYGLIDTHAHTHTHTHTHTPRKWAQTWQGSQGACLHHHRRNQMSTWSLLPRQETSWWHPRPSPWSPAHTHVQPHRQTHRHIHANTRTHTKVCIHAGLFDESLIPTIDHLCTHTYTYTHMRTQTHTHISTHTQTQTHTLTLTHFHKHTSTGDIFYKNHTHTHIQIHTPTHTHTHPPTHKHTHTQTYTYIHTRDILDETRLHSHTIFFHKTLIPTFDNLCTQKSTQMKSTIFLLNPTPCFSLAPFALSCACARVLWFISLDAWGYLPDADLKLEWLTTIIGGIELLAVGKRAAIVHGQFVALHVDTYTHVYAHITVSVLQWGMVNTSHLNTYTRTHQRSHIHLYAYVCARVHNWAHAHKYSGLIEFFASKCTNAIHEPWRGNFCHRLPWWLWLQHP